MSVPSQRIILDSAEPSNQPVCGTSSNMVILDLKNELEAIRVSEFGLSLEQVNIIAADSLEFERELRVQLLGETSADADISPMEEFDPGLLKEIMLSGARYLPYVETILRSGHFLTVCPASGRPVRSDASFVLDDCHVAYRFTSDVVFYLMVGRFHGRRAALCVPSRNMLITLDVPERGPAISQWVAQTMRRFIRLSVAQPDAIKIRTDAKTDELTLVVGGMNNFGHHVWQELAGIAQLLATGRLRRVRSLLIGPHVWFKIERVFPELSGLPQMTCASAEEMLAKGLRRPGTILRPVGLQITEDLRNRLQRAAAAEIGLEESHRIARAGTQCRLIWINLRAHNKMWISQVEGYASLLNELYDQHKDVGVVYDGWKDTASIRDEIDGRLRAGIVRHDTLGAPIESSLTWASAVTTYVSVVGSGLVLNSWLAHRPGVAHANRAHLRQQNFWNSVSQGMVPVTFIDPGEVSGDNTLYGNYDLDWRSLLPAVQRALAPSP